MTTYWSEQIAVDDNVFRLPSGVPAATGSRSDLIRTDQVGIKLATNISRQAVRFDGSLVHQHYANHRYLDFNAANGLIAWDWVLTSQLTGTVLAERRQDPVSFSDYRGVGVRNLRTTNTRLASLDYQLFGPWHVLGSVAHIANTAEDATAPTEDAFSLNRKQVGVAYVADSGSALQLNLQDGQGDYSNDGSASPSLVNAPFNERVVELRGKWKVSDKTELLGSVSSYKRDHPDLPQRDFSAVPVRIGLVWHVTEKSALVAGLARDISTWQTSYSNYIQSDALYLMPEWRPTEKIKVTLRIDRTRKSYRGDPFGTAPLQRVDVTTGFLAGIDWQILRNLSLAMSYQRGHRDSNYPGLDYAAEVAMANLRLSF